VDQRNAQMELRDAAPILARVHAECFLGDALGSLQCDCAAKLDQSMAIIGAAGRGAVVYLRHSAGAQIPTQTNRTCCAGSRNKAVDSDATERLMDHRELSSAASILGALGVRTVRLMTDNPDNCAGLRDLGVDVISSQPSATPGGSAADTHRTAKGQTDPVVGRLLVS
jgi:GTP cyclohydrolase II